MTRTARVWPNTHSSSRLIAIVAIVALIFLGSQVSDKLSVIGGTIHSVAP